MRIRVSLLLCSLLVAGCATGPKKVYAGPDRADAELAHVHPTLVPGGLMLIRAVDDLSTYSFSFGFLGSIAVLPGDHQFEVEVSHGFSVQDAGGPAWTPPDGVKFFPLARDATTSVFVTKAVVTFPGHVDANRVYEVKFGFDRADPAHPIPGVWLGNVPRTVASAAAAPSPTSR